MQDREGLPAREKREDRSTDGWLTCAHSLEGHLPGPRSGSIPATGDTFRFLCHFAGGPDPPFPVAVNRRASWRVCLMDDRNWHESFRGAISFRRRVFL
jgi:hypothetical protein